MELAFVIWAVSVIPAIAGPVSFFGLFIVLFCAGLCIFASVVSKTSSSDSDKNEAKVVREITSKILKWTVPIWFIAILVPDKTTSYQMLAAYGVQKVVENETTQVLASDGVDVLKALMAKAKRELAEETPKK